MEISKTSTDTEAQTPEDEDENSQLLLIPGLPNEIAELCLVRLPYPYHALVRSVSSTWNRAITNPNFSLSKKSLSRSLPYLFVFGRNDSTATMQWQALDLKSNRWFVLPKMPMPMTKSISPQSFSSVSIPLEGKLFVLGGMCASTESSVRTTVVYNTSTNQWSLGSPMLTARSFFSTGNINGKIIAVGGTGTVISEAISAVESYDPVTDTWRYVKRLQSALTKYDSAVIGDKLYVTEGWTWPFMFSPRGVVYDPKLDTWREMSERMKEGWTGVATVVDDRLFVVSEQGDPLLKVYVPEEDSWKFVSGNRFPREVLKRPFTVTGVDDRIFVVARGLNVAVGSVSSDKSGNGAFRVEWEVMEAPKSFHEYSPATCHVLYG